MSRSGLVVCDLRAIQSPDHRGRGIARWSLELATALERVRPDLVSSYLLDPEWPPPGDLGDLLTSRKLAYANSPEAARALEAARVYHCLSPFELGRPVTSLRPAVVERLGLSYSAVVYDLIPLRRPDEYLSDPERRQAYLAHLELLRHADAVLAISGAAAHDLEAVGGLGPARCHVVGTGVSSHFVPPRSREAVREACMRAHEGLKGPFVLYPGGNDGRKNLEGLVAAFAALRRQIRSPLQLVVVGELPPLTANHYRHLAGQEGIAGDLVLTGFVSDDQLRSLYQATDLLVFPSLAEGFGLPVAEALACGAVACVSDLAPFDELVTDPRARFDPTAPGELAKVMERCLTDESLRATLRREGASAVSGWDEVASRAAAVFESLAARPRRRGRKPTRRVAFVSPFPPITSGVAADSARLVAALAGRAERGGGPPVELELFGDGLDRYPARPDPVAGREVTDARAFLAVDAAHGGFDRVVYVLGNSECHASALASLRRRRGVVVCHDVRLSGLMTFSAEMPGAVPGGLEGAITRNYPLLPNGLGTTGRLSSTEQDRYGLLFVNEVAGLADRLLVSSEAARRLAALDTGPEGSSRLGVLPFALDRLSKTDRVAVEAARETSARRGGDREKRPCVASFGIVDPSKRPDVLVAAVADLAGTKGLEVDLVLAGPVSEELAERLRALAASLGIAERVQLTGNLLWESYLELLGRADLAVQLRASFNGEASAAVSECLSAGVATVTSRVGWLGELPPDAVSHVRRDCSPLELSGELARLLGDVEARRSLASRGQELAATRTFDETAEALLAELGY